MAARRIVTATHAVVVARPPAEVFDYTQDYAHRAEWDTAFQSTTVLGDEPRRIRATVRGLGTFTIVYKLDRRPDRTSAAFSEVDSPWFSGGGGSWSYEPTADGRSTTWTQTNTLELKHARLGVLLAPWIGWSLRASMRRSMARAAGFLARRS